MKGQNILVTGGAGFIGCHLVESLIKLGNKVTVIDSLISSTDEYIKGFVEAGTCIFIKGDIRDEKLMNSLQGPFNYLFHMAADPDVKSSVDRPVISFDHNVKGTLNTLELARRMKVKGYIFASSGGTVYGDVETFPVHEEFPLKPISPYGASKAAGEMYISAYANAYEFKAVSGRYANIFGERSTHGVSFDFYNRLRSNPKVLTILGDGMQQKSYLHVSDCVDATILIADNLSKQKKWYDYYNIGSNDWYTVRELASILEEEMGLKDVKHEFTGGEKGWVGDVHKLLLSIKKLEDLGWKPKYNLKQAMHLYISWLKTRQTKSH